jgi:hypothetical protein
MILFVTETETFELSGEEHNQAPRVPIFEVWDSMVSIVNMLQD